MKRFHVYCMVLSICIAILVPVAFYSLSPPFSNHPNINGNVPRPLASAFVDQDPKLYPAEFSPYSSPGYDDEVHLAFTPNQNVTANISITAHPRLLKTGSSGSPRPLCLVPIPEQGVLVMFASRDATDNGLFMARSTDNGSTWSDFATVPGIQTPAIGYPGAFYHNGTIHVIWGDIYNFQYVASTNLGDTWSTPYNFFYDGMIYTGEVYQLEFAVNPATGDFHVVYESLNYNDRRAFKTLNSTDGGNTWSEPVLVPEFNDTMIGVPVEYYKPSLAFRPNGNAIISGHGASMMMTKVCEYDNGILGAPLATNYLPDDGSTLAIDNSTGKLISLMCPNAEFTTNLRLKEITAISPSLELTTLEDCAWNLPSPMIHTYLSIYNTWIKCANGRVYYYSSDPMRLVGPGIYVLDFPLVVEGMTFENVEEAAIEQQEFHFAWDGLHSGQQVPYVEFLLSLTLTDMFKEVYVYHFTRDDTIPAVEDIAYTPYISPGIPDGVQDQFLANFTTSEYARYRYLIENGERETTDATTFLPDIYEKKNPIFLMDAEFNYYVFYHRIAKGVPEIAMAKSTDLGRTWDEPSPVISGSGVAEFGVTIHNTSIYAIVSNNFGIKNFLRSIDGGKHWETYNHQLTYFNGVHDKFIVETADNGTIFVGGYQNISIFLDGGRTYSHTVHFLAEPNDEIMGLAYDDPRQVLYIAWVDHKEGNAGELYGNITITAWNYSTSTILQARPLVQAWYLHVLGISVNDTTGIVTLVTTTNNASLTNSQGILNYWRSSDLGQSWTAEFIGLCDYAGTILYSIYKTPTWFVEPCRGVEIFGSSDQATTSAYFLTIQSRLPFLATGTAFVQSNLGGRIAYDGRYSNGTVLHDGNYTFHLITWDRTSGSQEYRLSFEVDNLVPLVSGIMNFPSNPLPRQDVSVSMIAIEKNLRSVDLIYNYDDSDWITVSCEHITGNQWNASIPGNGTASRLKYYIRVVDRGGNVLSETAGGFYYGWENPVIPFVSPVWNMIEQLDDEPEFTTASELSFDFIFSDYISQYLARIFVNYSTDGQTWLTLDLTRDGTRFNGSIGPFGSSGFETLQYEVLYEDILGEIAPITAGETIIAPVMPAVMLNPTESILLFIMCIGLGLIMGYGLSSAIFPDQLTPYEHYVKSFVSMKKIDTDKKSNDGGKQRARERDLDEQDMGGRIPLLQDDRFRYNPIRQGFVRSLRLQTVSWIGSISLAVVLLVMGLGDIALIISVGAFLITVFLFFSALAYEIQQIGRRYTTLKQGLREIVGASFLLFGSLMLIFVVGYFVDWFRYYYLQPDFSLVIFSIPSILFDLCLTFTTSIMLLVYFTHQSLRGLHSDMVEKAQLGASFQELFINREDELDGLSKDLILELFFFIFFVGYSLVLVVDLSRYEQLGMLLGGGLLLGVAMMLVYFWTIGRRARPPTGIVSSQTTCSSCKCSVLSGNFCGKCGKQLLLTDQLVENLIKCPSCEAYNSSASQRCRICGNELPGLSPTVVTSKNNEKGTSRAKTN